MKVNKAEDMQKKVSELQAKIREKLHLVKKYAAEKKDYGGIINDIWKLSKQKFIMSTQLKTDLKKYQGLIFTVGFSPQPIILSILGLTPDCIYLIYTKESEHTIDDIIQETNLKPSQYKRELMPKVSAADSYRLVKEGIKFLTEEKGISLDKIAIDPTGGTKIMSVGCGIAATIFNLDILYVNNQKYDAERRSPEFGSEILIAIPNPFDIYQDNKILEGLNYLKKFEFSYARELFYSIKQSSTNPLLPELIANLSEVLYFWDMVDYSGSLKSIERARKSLESLGLEISPIKNEISTILLSWEDFLRSIQNKISDATIEIEKISPSLIYDIKENADREFDARKYNNAALKYYRNIEMINQYILYNEYGIDTQNPNYPEINFDTIKELRADELDFDIETYLIESYNSVWQKIDLKRNPEKTFKASHVLPRKIGLIAGIIFRHILHDSSIDENFIYKTLEVVENRNNSIYAHGIASINKNDCQRLKEINEKMLKRIDIEEEHKFKIFSKKNIQKLQQLLIKVI